MPGRKRDAQGRFAATWTTEQDALLQRCYGLVTVRELASQLARTEEAVYSRIKSLHIQRYKSKRRYSGEEIDEWAEAQQRGDSLRSIERRTGVGHSVISRKIKERREQVEKAHARRAKYQQQRQGRRAS